MIVTTSADTHQGPGHAIFTLQPDDASSPLPAEEAGILFSIRNSSGASLGRGKWVQGKATFSADSIAQRDDSLFAYFGPSVVDHLDPMETYQLCMAVPGGDEHYGTFFLENVLPSSARVKNIPAHEEAPPPAPTPAPPPPAPEAVIPSFPEPQQEPEPVVEIKPVPAPEPIRPREEPPAKSKSMLYAVLAAVLVLLVAGGGAYYWFFLKSDGAIIATGPETVDSIRKFLATNPDTDALGKKFSGTQWGAESADARFLLAEELAGRGNAEAMAVVAEFYDPSSTIASGSIVKDAEQAYNGYTAAKKAGLAGMDTRLATLKEWLQKQADQGSDEAKNLLRNWQ